MVMTWRRHDALLANAVRHHGHTFVLTIMERRLRMRCACVMCAIPQLLPSPSSPISRVQMHSPAMLLSSSAPPSSL
eukprot:2052536-Pyramimonas_sp.AAC.1